MSQRDDDFIRNFSIIIGGLAVFAVVLLIFANIFHNMLASASSEARQEAVVSRLQPIGKVYAGEAGVQALAVATKTASTGGGSDEPLTGEQVFSKVCSTCHKTGVAGAPTLDMAHWKQRIAKGKETLISHAMHGFRGESGFMPPKGGHPSLTKKEVTRAVEYMLAQVKSG